MLTPFCFENIFPRVWVELHEPLHDVAADLDVFDGHQLVIFCDVLPNLEVLGQRQCRQCSIQDGTEPVVQLLVEEELADAHRLLSERSREAETMRRLLADAQGRADARVREMQERLDIAVEERERAEEQASTFGRRRARELEELKQKVRDAERAVTRAQEDKEELVSSEKELRRQKDDLEKRAAQASEEAGEVRTAMSQLRDALDDSEKQARDLEKEKAELRKAFDESQGRLEKLQKSSKAMSDELRSLKTKVPDVPAQSSRSSLESSRSRIASPAPKAPASDGASGAIDYVYLKNVLLQFLEQKDRKYQQQLIPVLGMLLHFDK